MENLLDGGSPRAGLARPAACWEPDELELKKEPQQWFAAAHSDKPHVHVHLRPVIATRLHQVSWSL